MNILNVVQWLRQVDLSLQAGFSPGSSGQPQDLNQGVNPWGQVC